MKKPSRRKAHLLGVGLDNEDGHKRITCGDDFSLVGGSAETHERMTETTLKAFEELKNRGKTIHDVDPKEFADILHRAKPKS